MRSTSLKIISLATVALTATSIWAQRPFYLVDGMHPGYSLVSVRPAVSTTLPTGQPNVGGMAFLPDGRLFVASMSTNSAGGTNANRLGPSDGYVFSGIVGAKSGATVTVTKVGGNYQMPTGAVALGDTLYAVDNDSGLTKLTPNGSGGYVKSVVYSGLLGYLNSKSTGSGYRTWVGGLAYKDGYFYANVGMGLIPGGTSEFTDANIYRGKGTVLKIKKDGSTVDTVAGGIRNPVSLTWGPENELFYTDNQGSFMPASALFHVKQGRFFGHPKTPFDNQLRTPPAIIFPYGSTPTGGTASNPVVARVASSFVVLRDPRYRGQMLVGTAHTTGTNRVFLEKVGGEYQGAVFPFSQGFGVGAGSAGASSAIAGILSDFRANPHSFAYGPDGFLYVGGGNSPGDASQGSHGFVGTTLGGLARMVPNKDTVFEMKAVRSLNSTQLEIEFTEPVLAIAASNFTVRQGVSIQGGSSNDQSYGAGYISGTNTLAVTAATLNTAKTRATLTITGLQERPAVTTAGSVQDRTWGSLIQINVTGVASASGRTMWGDGTGGGVAWYTLNKFGPGVDVAVDTTGSFTGVVPGSAKAGVMTLQVRRSAEGIRVTAPVSGSYSVRVSDLRGKTIVSYPAASGDFVIPSASLGGGMNVLEARAADGQHWITSLPKL